MEGPSGIMANLQMMRHIALVCKDFFSADNADFIADRANQCHLRCHLRKSAGTKIAE